MRISKKILAAFLAALMAISMMPFTVFAAPPGSSGSGTGASGGISIDNPTVSGFLVNGTDHYETLEAAIAAAPSGATITMLEDATINTGSSSSSRFAISKSLTFEGNDHTVTINNRGFGVGMNASAPVDVTFKDITITNPTNAGRCVDTRGNLNSLTLDNATLKTTGTSGYLQPLTIGGNQSTKATVNITDSTIQTSDDGSKGYAIITFNPVDMTIDDSTVKGWACIYAKGIDGSAGSAGSTFTITDSTLTSKNSNSGLTNAFGTLVVEDSDIDFDISGCDISIDGEANHQFLFTNNVEYLKDYVNPDAEIEDVTVALGAGNNVELKAMGDFSVDATDDVTLVISGGTFSAPVPEEFCADGYTGVNGATEGTYTVATTDGYVAKVDGVLYADLEDAIDAAQAAGIDTVTLVNDVDLTSYPAKGQHRIDITNVTIDLNQHTFTASGRWGVLFEGTNATIKNGTMEAIDNSDATGYQYGVYVWGGDGSDNMPDPAQKASVTLENLTVNYGIHTYNAEVTVKDCDVTGSSAYYAIWADCESTVNVESGNFTTGGAAVLGTAQYQHTLFGHINVEGGNFTVPAGKKLIQNGSSCETSNTQFKGGTIKNANGTVFEVLDENLAPNYAQNMTTGEVFKTAAEDAQSIEVADTITENFYIDEDFYGEDAKVQITYNHNSNASETPDFKTETVDIDTLPAVDGGRKISIPQAPAQITEPVEINIIKNDVVVETYETNAYEYCRAILEDSTQPAELKEVAESTLDYAAAAQLYFNYNTGNMATKDVAGDFYNDVNNADLSGVAGFVSRPAGFVSASMVVKSDLEVNLLSTGTFAVSGASLDTTRGGSRFAATATGKNGAYYVLNVTGIEPANMNNTITVNTDQGDVVFTANTIMKALSNSSNAKVATLAKACYLYGVAAENYFA
ncbi:MAG: hypothetical protein IJI47_00650 [Eubacterium sp.]|nr:hypothetical protein [Eubacterium sp.]